MGNYFCLANFDKKEYIAFNKGMKEHEIILTDQAKLVAYYLFENSGDRICFLGDEWNPSMPFENIHYGDEAMETWKNVTKEYEDELRKYDDEMK
jgi:hypothetical protein